MATKARVARVRGRGNSMKTLMLIILRIVVYPINKAYANKLWAKHIYRI